MMRQRVSFGGFEDNLEEFLNRMYARGYKIVAFFPYYDSGLDIMQYKSIEDGDLNHIAYQALNFEHTNIRLENEETDSRATISVMLTGDDWCDVVPINDWSFQRDRPDIVDEVVQELREELLGDDA